MNSSSSGPADGPIPVSAAPVRFAPSGNDKAWALVCHLSGFIGLPFLLPLIVYLAMKRDSAYAAENAKEALNFHLSLLLYLLCCLPLVLLVVGIPLLGIIWVLGLVFAVVAAIKVTEGETYRYPLTIRFVR